LPLFTELPRRVLLGNWASVVRFSETRLFSNRTEEIRVIASLWAGSKGTDEESFTIRIPINISPSSRITTTPGESPLNIAGRPAAIFEEHGYYILEVYGFRSEEAAHESLPSIQASVVWAALRHGISLPFSRQPATVIYDELLVNAENELTRHFLEKGWDRLDGYYRSGHTVIKPEHKRLYVEHVGNLKLVPNVRDHELARTLDEASEFPHPEKLFHDENENLRRALNTYMSSFSQFDANARFLTLVIVLEILNPDRQAPQHVKDTVDQLRAQVKELRNTYDKDEPSSRYEDYDYLLDRLRHLKDESIRRGIGSLVAEKLQADPEVSDPESLGQAAMKIYDLRSRLVHSGAVDEGEVQEALRRLMLIIPRVLAVMVLQATHDT